MRSAAGALFALCACIAAPVPAQAQGSFAEPAEFPPQSYRGSQYVDSEGCVFVRAGSAGATTWVPRVNRSREQLCGFRPTAVQGATTADASRRAAAIGSG